MGNKKTTKQTSNTTQTAAPPSWTMPGIQETSDRVMAALKGLPTTKYEGDFVATPDSAMLSELLNSYRTNAGRAEGFGNQITGAANNLSAPIAFGGTRPELTQFQGDNGGARLDAAIRASVNPVFKQLQEQILPSIRSSALESGAYSGDRAMGVVPTMALDQASESANRIASELAYSGFQQEEDRRLQGHNSFQDQMLQMFGLDTTRGLGTANIETERMAMLPAFLKDAMSMFAGSSDLLSMGMDRDTAARQAAIDNARAKDDYGYQSGFRGLDIATDLLSRLSGGYGTTTGNSSSTTVEKTGGLGSVVQGLAGLAGLAASVLAPGAGGLLGSAGAAASGAGAFGSSLGKMLPSAASLFSSPAYANFNPGG